MAPSVDEIAATQGTPLSADLAAGVDAVSYNQTVVFTKYIRLVLPLDGYVFWVRADLVSASALLNAAALNSVAFNQPMRVVTPAPTLTAKGSLHYATETRQDETETYAVNTVVFTSEQEVTDLNQVGPNVLYIATFDGMKFAFSSRASFYKQAGLFHYRGQAVYSDMETQVIDAMSGFDSRSVVVSNSLPVWLSLNGYAPFYYPAFGANPITLYPSFALPNNLTPPFGAVHIDPAGTRALQMAPILDSNYSHWQLAADRVRITLYGLRNFNALDFVDCVNQFSVDYDYIGIMNQPVVRDEKRTQSELNALAMKKSIEFEVSYYQTRVNDLARQLIKSALVTYDIHSL